MIDAILFGMLFAMVFWFCGFAVVGYKVIEDALDRGDDDEYHRLIDVKWTWPFELLYVQPKRIFRKLTKKVSQ